MGRSQWENTTVFEILLEGLQDGAMWWETLLRPKTPNDSGWLLYVRRILQASKINLAKTSCSNSIHQRMSESE